MSIARPGMLTAACAAAVVLALAATAATSRADDYPTRPVKIVVPYAAGGPSDTGARLVVEPLSRQLGKPVFIENRGGGGGMNATEAYLAGEPDGYTILVGGIGPFAIIPAVKKVGYDVEKDFVPLGTVWRSAQVLAIRPGLDVRTLSEFVAKAKASPGTITIGSAGVGAITHLAIELLKHEAGIDLVHIPFRSTSESLPSLLGGQIDALFGDPAIIGQQVRAGKIKALAIAAPQRTPVLPDVVTMAEAGYPGVRTENWFGLVVNARTPPEIVKRLQTALAAAQRDPAYVESLARQEASAGELGPESFATLIKSDVARWKAVIAAAKIKLD
jgi:tripartite-type tricarboxylate transporter receptor subunit TctC